MFTSYNNSMFDETLLSIIINKHSGDVDKKIIYEKDKCYSYRDLFLAAYNNAKILAEKNISTGSRVVVVSHRCYEYIYTILSILMRTAIFIPVDSSYPDSRIEAIINDVNADAVIFISHEIRLPKYKGIIIGRINQNNNNIDIKDINIEFCKKNSLAYIMYTSGTTGQPKGVMVSHYAIVNTLMWMARQFNISEDECIAFKTSISFTDSIWEIFLPLIYNTKMVIISDFDSKNPKKLIEIFFKYKISISQFVPSMLNVFLLYVEKHRCIEKLLDLKWILNGGEYITPDLVRRFYDVFKSVNYANVYGMTESAIYATCYIVNKDDVLRGQIPIGYPISNTKICVLDIYGNKCKANEKGEICVSGRSLADGYYNDLDLTKNKFVKYKNGEIIYKTGDIGYFDIDGCLWYAGRLDSQVKIRGNRVEIYDVEECILRYPHISQVVVVAKKDEYGETSLWCFLDKDVCLTELKKYLNKSLPKYMIPQYFVIISAFPLTENKKIDRKRLSEESFMTMLPNQNNHQVLDEKKQKIFTVWEKLLPYSAFSEDDDFFDVGGDSIKAIRMQIMLEKEKITITLEDINKYRTINNIYRYVNGEKDEL